MLLDYEMEYKLIALTGPIISSEQPNVNMVIVAVLRYQTRVIPWLPEAPIRPVSTKENKHRTELSPFCTIHTAGPKKLKILQLFIIRVADHRFKLEQKIGTESPCAGSILF